MDAVRVAREAKRQELLLQLAELMVEDQVEEGVFLETPHYSVIELAAMHLGHQLSRQAQQRAAREVAARCPAEANCPTCDAACVVQTQTRQVRSLSGPVEMTETVAHCRRGRRSFFPSACGPGPG